MKKSFFVAVFLAVSFLVNAQEKETMIQPGTTFTLAAVDGDNYRHIKFPRKNIIIKRGAIANFNELIGEQLVVSEVKSGAENTYVVLKRKNGKPFFRFFPTVDANLEKALERGELRAAEPTKNQLAQK
ncbi:hypothetical protein FK220_005060 [Flavobacteriaceae bacterium TP-CH-4]|uniref:Pilus formation protein N-terminal domain-containing protein n=1 Tax=Pelagihabitans pacificus TaxID=2696054 RepID=A0A967E4S8_9FLAO|nr:hypothetical protein [Pelagihabitans pacificus]NHF58697.1 hypothetical protein [Pelagihabitans pacificus]